MNRKEAERAVLEAVRMHDRKALEHEGHLSPRLRQAALDYRATLTTDDNLNICTEPDLDAHNAAVAEAVEAYIKTYGDCSTSGTAEFMAIFKAGRARRAALAPKPRYESLGACIPIILDRKTGMKLTAHEAASALNVKEEKP